MNRRVLVVAALLIGVSIWNGVYEVAIPAPARSLRFHTSDDLRTLMAEEQRSLPSRFDIYLLLEPWGRGQTLVAPPGVLYAGLVDGLADMVLVESDDASPELDPDQLAALLAIPGAEGELQVGDEEEPRRLLVIPPSDLESRLRLVLADGTAVVIGESALAQVIAGE